MLFVILILVLIISCDDIIEVEDISGRTVLLIAPSEGAVIQSNTATFTWQSVEDAEEYLLQVVMPNFANAAQIVIDTAVVQTSFTKELLPNNYEWRVKALNSGFETGFSSHNFAVQENEGFANNTVVLLSPSNNFAINETSISLSWDAIEEATEYRLQILDATEEIVVDQTTIETVINSTFSEGSFTWQVRAQNATQNTLFSSRNIVIDLTNPNTPVLTTPANNSNQNNSEITFSWTREDVSGSQELDSIYVYGDNNLQNLVIKGQGTDKTFTATLQPNTYYWVVKAFDNARNESPESAPFNFTIK